MCTALTLQTKEGYHLFGRNMDIEVSFNQSVALVPRNFTYKNRATNEMENTKYAMIGMGTIIDEHPCYAEAMNEKGLACAGLNFPGYSYWEEDVVEGKINIAPYDLILWALGNFECINDLREDLEKINLVARPVNENIPLPTLHWIIYDARGECIVVEKTKDGLRIFENKIGILTNAPTFDWHMTNLTQYMGVSSHQPSEIKWGDIELKALGQGAGGKGLPGDFSSPSRFVKATFLRSNAVVGDDYISAINEFFHILNSVAMVKGSVVTPQNLNDITQYTSCMLQEKGIYYYNTYNNSTINAIDMNKENLDAKEIKIFEYRDKQFINFENR
ncbi:choloylglycine hydrolase [Clostridium sp.]|uniref:choloylglycine hydrolase n=1 Tax=Clostridium sp. TaxID=1506 RepID=UPI002913AF00|nr:choloylglycine hydrolase [Clostridium sp.]MDU7241671.1 choloylglycine hydrolase [Clostridium sp.]